MNEFHNTALLSRWYSYRLVGSFQTISSVSGKIYCHDEIHSNKSWPKNGISFFL